MPNSEPKNISSEPMNRMIPTTSNGSRSRARGRTVVAAETLTDALDRWLESTRLRPPAPRGGAEGQAIARPQTLQRRRRRAEWRRPVLLVPRSVPFLKGVTHGRLARTVRLRARRGAAVAGGERGGSEAGPGRGARRGTEVRPALHVSAGPRRG